MSEDLVYVGAVGSFSSVLRVHVGRPGGEHYMLNVFSNEESQAVDLQQINTLKTLTHQNIVKYIVTIVYDGKNAVLMELCEGRTMKDYLESQQAPLNEQLISEWSGQLTEGLHYLHNAGVIHGDLQPSNVILHNSQLKLSHFGLWSSAQQLLASIFKHYGRHTRLYLAPELFKNNPQFHAKCDVWALGCIMHELCTLNAAFTSVEDIIQSEPDDTQYPESLKDTIKKMLLKCASERATRPQQIGDYIVLGTGASKRLTYYVTRNGRTFTLKQFLPYEGTTNMISDLKCLSHKFIVKLEEWFLHTENNKQLVCFVFEHCERSFADLFAQQLINKEDILSYVAQVLIGILHLHEIGLIHANIKPNNIFLCSPTNNVPLVKISDFNADLKLDAKKSWTIKWLDPDSCYRAPEMWSHLNSPYYRNNVDTWSVGCFAYECWNGRPLFNDVNWKDTVNLTAALKRKKKILEAADYSIDLPTECSLPFQIAIRSMLLVDADMRLDCSEMLHNVVECDHHKLAYLASMYEPILISAVPEQPMTMVSGEIDASLYQEPDSDGFYRLQASGSEAQTAWHEIVNERSALVLFPIIKLARSERKMQMALVRRDRPTPPMRSPDSEALDATGHLGAGDALSVARDLRLWLRFLDDCDPVTLRIEVKLRLIYRLSNHQRSKLLVRKIREMKVGGTFTNVLIHFQPMRMVLVDGQMPRVRVKIAQVSESL